MRKLLKATVIGSVALGIGALFAHTPARDYLPSSQVQAAAQGSTFRRVWSADVPNYRSASLSPDGKYIGILTTPARSGAHTKLSLWKWMARPASPVWTKAQPGATQLSISRGGAYSLTWAAMDPTQRQLTLRRGSDGASLMQHLFDGTLWNTQLSADGEYAAISTGANSLYLLSLEDAPKLHRWTLPGLGGSLAFSPQTRTLTAATWDTSTVSCYTLRGASVWQFPAAEAVRTAYASRIYDVQAARSGSAVLGVSYTNVGRGDAGLYVWRTAGNGAPTWHYALGTDASQPKAAISANGRTVAVSYIKVITRGTQTISERRLLYLDTQRSTQLWEQGNLLFSPQLVALSPDGECVTITDGQHSLYNFNAQGRVTATYTLHGTGTIKQISATPDGHYVLVYTSDSLLSLLQIGE